MKAVITGGTGFVGKAVVTELINRNVEVTALVSNKDKYQQSWQDIIKLVECPLDKLSIIEPDTISEDKIDLFIHLGWDGTSGNKRADIRRQLDNVLHTCDAVDLAMKLGCKRFIYAGSVMEYEAMNYIPLQEAKPGMGNIYSIAKLSADLMAKTKAVNSGIEFINLLISNIYGAGERSARFVNTIIRKMMLNEPVPLTPGEQLYDFIYVTDAAKQIVLAAIEGTPNGIYYIGNTKQRKLKEYVTELKVILNSSSQLCFGEIPYNNCMLSFREFNTSRIENEFGFIPEVNFKQGVLLIKEEMNQENE